LYTRAEKRSGKDLVHGQLAAKEKRDLLAAFVRNAEAAGRIHLHFTQIDIHNPELARACIETELPSGDPAIDWHLTHSPNGGFMIKTAAMGLVFLDNADEDLDFVSRMP